MGRASHADSGLCLPQMLSGGKAGLVSADLLRREQQEFKKQAGSSNNSRHLEGKNLFYRS